MTDQARIKVQQEQLRELRKERHRLKEALIKYIVHGKVHGEGRAAMIAEEIAKGKRGSL